MGDGVSGFFKVLYIADISVRLWLFFKNVLVKQKQPFINSNFPGLIFNQDFLTKMICGSMERTPD